MRIVFMGTPECAVPCLERLVSDGHEVVGVFTQPDKPSGRGMKLHPSAVKTVAVSLGLPVLTPVTLSVKSRPKKPKKPLKRWKTAAATCLLWLPTD